jgi:putative hydrolase of the HAD superfamily
MIDIYRAEGVGIDVEAFLRCELEARRVLHEHVDEGHNGTEPELWRDYFLALFERSGVPAQAVDAVSERVRAEHAREHLWTYAHPWTGDALASLAAAGYRVGVISNADGRMEGALERAGVRAHVEFVLDSGRVGVEKPDAAIFLAGCEAIGAEPEACVYVGDLYPVDYVGAVAAGLRAVLLDPLEIHAGRAAIVRDLRDLEGWLAG